MIRLRPFLALWIALVFVACDATVSPTPSRSSVATLSEVPAGVDMTPILARTALPVNDPFALTRTVRGRAGEPGPFQPARTAPLNRQVGDRDEFWFYNDRTKTNEKLTAIVRQRSDHAYWYVQEGIAVDPSRLQQTVLAFEGQIYPTDHKLFGEEWSPGIDADPRITILIARIPNVGGYFSAADELPRWVNPFSNEREMIYVNIEGAPIGSSFLLSTLAHEFSHMIEFAKGRPSSVWFNEGQAQTAEQNNGFPPSTPAQFLREPDTQLTDWKESASEAGANYGHAFLFLQYLSERFGGPQLIRDLMEKGVMTPLDVDAALRQRGVSGVEDAYLDFVATIGMLDQPDPPAPYRYTVLKLPVTLRVARAQLLTGADPVRSSVHQYAVRFFELPPGKVAIDLAGATSVRLLPTDPHSGGALWWSYRGDGSDMSLTRSVDLRGVDRATLQYWTWFDIEQDFDYAYVEVSEDGGKTWKTLKTGASTDKDPNGTNLGNGITGRSGGGSAAKWVTEHVDLSSFARKQILLRFEYVTDQAYNKDGFAVDDLSIPEIGWSDDAEADRDWSAAGFVRSSNVVRERFVAQSLSFGASPSVTRAATGVDGKLHLETTIGERGGLLAVTAFAAATTQPGGFEFRVTRP